MLVLQIFHAVVYGDHFQHKPTLHTGFTFHLYFYVKF